MNARNLLRSLLMVTFIISLSFGSQPPAAAQGRQTLTGWLSILYGDGPDGVTAPQTVYLLTDKDGNSTQLQLDQGLSVDLLALDRQPVTVSGAAAQLTVDGREVVGFQVEDIQPTGGDVQPAVSGTQPFISIMCKFSDYAQEPKNLSYFQNMYGSTYPGLNHYWREVSYNLIDINGSNAVGWYTLPQPRSYYVYNNQLDFDRAATDCTGVADPYVNFAGFVGINLMFNAELDNYAWGGTHLLTLDGVSKVWPMTWEPPWGYSAITVMSHEMGHAFGMPHSSGNYGATYDNRWDVMSDTWTDCSKSTDSTYGCLGQHPIIYQKDLVGWIPASLKYTLNYSAVPSDVTENGVSTGAYLIAKIPFGSYGYYYTVEARQRPGYDIKLPNVAIVIHEVEPTRYSSPAHVIDIDNNGNTGDAGAIWAVGETFAENGVSVQVLSTTTNGYMVHIQNGSASATIEIDSNAQLLIFGDVPMTYWAASWINKLYNNGVTGGCYDNPLMYCPMTIVTRAQMAVFLLRAKYGSSYTPPAVGVSTGFNDVSTSYWAAPWIKALAAEGITGGCSNGNYCPELAVTRDSMAVFLLRAKYGSSYTPPAVGASTGFSDVPISHWAAAWIKQLAAEGITGGCTASTYCPGTAVSRDQMAVFLVNTFNLP